jgi:hypothetical protein
MFKFNSDNIFTGYLKQLLHDFNLPKFRVYTKEQADYVQNYNSRVKKYLDDKKVELTENKQCIEQLIARVIQCKTTLTEALTAETPKTKIDEITNKILELDIKLEKLNIQLEKNEAALETLNINTAVSEVKKELNVIETVYRTREVVYQDTVESTDTKPIIYPLRMRYAPYIKDGKIQEYVDGK